MKTNQSDKGTTNDIYIFVVSVTMQEIRAIPFSTESNRSETATMKIPHKRKMNTKRPKMWIEETTVRLVYR